MRLRPAPPRTGATPAAAALAPLVDVLTLLVVFLLLAFSTDPPVDPGEPGFRLPAASPGPSPSPALAVDVTLRAIHLGGERIAATPWYAEHDEGGVRELAAALAGRPPGPVQLRVDARVPWRVVRQILATLRAGGHAQVTLVAASRAGL